jgi:hypothetical protein
MVSVEIKTAQLAHSFTGSSIPSDVFSWQNVNVYSKSKKSPGLNLLDYFKKSLLHKTISIDKELNGSSLNLTNVSSIETYSFQNKLASETESNQSITYSDLANSSTKVSSQRINNRQILTEG